MAEFMQYFVQLKDGFVWKSRETFLSAPIHVAALLVGYIGLSFLIQYFMKNRSPANVTGLPWKRT